MDAADIVEVVREFVTLRKAGVNYKGLCPFHHEKTPSFTVSPAKQLCKCFSCGKGGNAVNFLMQLEQMTYPEALKWLARKYGIEVREKELTDEEKLVFKTFKEISPMEIITQAAQRQQYIDQSQSLNLMIPSTLPVKDVNNLYITAWQKGVKTLYYQRSTSVSKEELSNIVACGPCSA